MLNCRLLQTAVLMIAIALSFVRATAQSDEELFEGLSSAKQLIQNGQAAKAITILWPIYDDFHENRDWRTPIVAATLGDALISAGRINDASDLLEGTLPRISNQASVEIRRQVAFRLAAVRALQGRFDAARNLYNDVIELSEGASDELSVRARESLVEIDHYSKLSDALNQAEALERSGQHDAAEAFVASLSTYEARQEVAFELSERLSTVFPHRTVRWLTLYRFDDQPVERQIALFETLGVAHFDLGDFDKAIVSFKKIAGLGELTGDNAIWVRGVRHLSGAMIASGKNVEEAIDLGEKALDAAPALGQIRLDLLLNLANAYRASGKLGFAQRRLAEARDVVEGIRPRTTDVVIAHAAVRSQTGNISRLLGNLVGAEAEYRGALNLLNESGSATVHVEGGKAIVIGNLAQVLLLQGRYSDAEPLALNLVRKVGQDPFAKTRSLSLLGTIQRNTNLTEARRTLRLTLVAAANSGHPSLILSAHYNLALLEMDEGNWSQALLAFSNALSLLVDDPDPIASFDVHLGTAMALIELDRNDEALRHLKAALDAHEHLRSASVTDTALQKVQEQGLKTYEFALSLALTLGRADQAWEFAERARARLLFDRLASETINVAEKERAAERVSWGRVENARHLMENEAFTAADYKEARSKYFDALNEHRERVERILQSCSNCLEFTATAPYELADFQKSIPPRQTVISYFQLPEQLVAFVVSGGSASFKILPVKRGELTASIDALLRFDSDALPPQELPLLADLYNRLWAPFSSDIRTEAVIIAPHGVLHRIPFAALWTEERYLVEDLEVSVLPSASVLPFLNPPTDSAKKTLVIGTSGSKENVRLAFATEEAKRIAALYGHTPLLEDAATESAVRAALSEATVVHFAAHASLEDTNPYLSAVSLVASKGFDGLLQLSEVLALKMSGQPLVVLSACESLSGLIRIGDEMTALQRGFLSAGASAVVASLWVVDDEASAELMVRLHTAHIGGAPVSAALRKAQLELLRETGWQHPFYWAGFVSAAR